MDKCKILELLADMIDIEKDVILEAPMSTKLSNLGLSSIQFIQFIVAIEDEFNIEILDSDLIMSKFETIEKLMKTLEKYFIHSMSVKKVLICDCDNVLWHGIAGEEDIFVDNMINEFQKSIIELYNSGILICLCSKNNSENIEQAFKTLNMPLKREYILNEKINMSDKVTNIKKIASELQLSPDSFVFVDDTKYELELVSSIIPEITTVQADYSDLRFIDIIRQYFILDVTDSNRTNQYKEQKEREKQKTYFSTVEEFNDSLETILECSLAKIPHASRISELSLRTNQFNLSNARYTESEIISYIRSEEYSVYILSASDKYGDMGIVGATIIQKSYQPVIIAFFLSCRVFGRGFEIDFIKKIKDDFSKTKLFGVYNKTDKNKRFEDFYFDNEVECIKIN